MIFKEFVAKQHRPAYSLAREHFGLWCDFLGVSSISGNQEPDKDPNSWPGVVWRYIKAKPALDVVSIILLLLVAYFIGRMFAIDPLEPMVEVAANKFSLPAGPPDISGNWEYRCVSYDGLQVWGGNVYFQQKKERFGQVIKVSGQRKWMGNVNSSDRHNISPPIDWEADGGVFVSDDTIQYRYFTNTVVTGDLSEGFTRVHLYKTNGQVDRMEGRFSEVSKKDPKYGSMEVSRK